MLEFTVNCPTKSFLQMQLETTGGDRDSPMYQDRKIIKLLPRTDSGYRGYYLEQLNCYKELTDKKSPVVFR